MRAPLKAESQFEKESNWSYFCRERAYWPGEGQGMNRETESSRF